MEHVGTGYIINVRDSMDRVETCNIHRRKEHQETYTLECEYTVGLATIDIITQ